MVIAHPDYPQIVLAFEYKGWRVDIDEGQWHGQPTYAAWASHQWGCAVAVPTAVSRQEAIRRAKRWIDRQTSSVSPMD